MRGHSVRGLMRSRRVQGFPYRDAFRSAERTVLEAAISHATGLLRADSSLDLAHCSEVDITVALEATLNRMLETRPSVVSGFSKAIFQTVVRGAEVCCHDFSMPEKRPDLTFRSQRPLPNLEHPHQCALFTECKIVDKTHAIGLYGTNGISRFVSGVYAWAVPSALMIAYTRHGRSLATQLTGLLTRRGTEFAVVGDLEIDADRGRASSLHRRALPHLPRNDEANVSIRHLWFSLTPAKSAPRRRSSPRRSTT